MNTEKRENEWVWMEIRGHYFFVNYKSDTILTLDAAKEIISDAIRFASNKTYPVLTDIRNMPSHYKDVREYFANEGSKHVCANAILVSNPLSRILANFFLSINKPVAPTKLFTEEEKAAKWLEMFPVKHRAN